MLNYTDMTGFSDNAMAQLPLDFQSIQLAEMNSVALLNRREAKFVLSWGKLAQVLAHLGDGYAILDIDGCRAHNYRTLYFDTEDFAMYGRHHAGALNRYKIRAREYVDTHATYFEVKLKTNKRQTVKSRFLTPELITDLHTAPYSAPLAFLQEQCPYSVKDLVPCLWNTYTRFTLVNLEMAERVTIDLNLSFNWQDEQIPLPGVAIAEVKQSGRPRASQFLAAMRRHHIHPMGFSKYCIGVSLLHPQVKINRFKSKLGLLHKLMQESGYELH